ncbi:hypothetical protein KM043_017082 [Ampulex compressa]|nr:hypothetical protein KM043_017082 [Ampulex compressa]
MDFLAAHNLLLDVKRQLLVDNRSQLKVIGIKAELGTNSVRALQGKFLVAAQYKYSSSFIDQLREQIEKLQSTETSGRSKITEFMYKNLATRPHVFVRSDGPKETLQDAYKGLFEVVKK